MKTFCLFSLILMGFGFFLGLTGCHSSKKVSSSGITALPAADTAHVAIDLTGIHPASIQNFDSFKVAVMPLIDQMASRKFVALGEGTHGTSEFYKIRYWITRILVEEKGFTHIAFENDYGDALLLNEGLQGEDVDYAGLMKKYLFAIWQNKETEELFKWIHTYNATHPEKVNFAGIDHAYAGNDARILKDILSSVNDAELNKLTDQLLQYSLCLDSSWNNQNVKGYTMDRDKWLSNGLNGYKTVEEIEALLPALSLPEAEKEKAEGITLNAKLAFDVFNQYVNYKRDSPRDSCMAEMAAWIVRKPEDKLIIWAHNAHVITKDMFNDSKRGGTGGYIEKKFPGDYFVLGTGTARGTFGATHDNFPTPTNRMFSAQLELPVEGSWEKSFASTNVPSFYVDLKTFDKQNNQRLHRMVGFRPESGKDTYVKARLGNFYDAFFFITETKAADFMQ